MRESNGKEEAAKRVPRSVQWQLKKRPREQVLGLKLMKLMPERHQLHQLQPS